MQTVDTRSQIEQARKVERVNRRLIALVVVLALALIGLGVWLALDAFVLGGEGDLEAMLTDYHEAWQDLDPERVASFFAPAGAFRFVATGEAYIGSDAIAEYVAGYPQGAVMEFGDIAVSESGAFATATYRWEDVVPGTVFEGVSVFGLVGDEILHHYVHAWAAAE